MKKKWNNYAISLVDGKKSNKSINMQLEKMKKINEKQIINMQSHPSKEKKLNHRFINMQHNQKRKKMERLDLQSISLEDGRKSNKCINMQPQKMKKE